MIPQPSYSSSHGPAPQRFSPAQVAAEQAEFMRKVYAYMAGGLGLTALAAWLVAHSPTALQLIIGNRLVFYALLAAELVMVISFSAMARRMTASGAGSLFFLYAITNGLTLSVIFLVYTTASIASTFLVTAGTFAGMSAYGYFTKRDLTGVGHFAIMCLWGLILDALVSMIFGFNAVTWLTTGVGILVFVALTAYDTQKITQLNVIGNAGTDEDTKEAIHGALVLYLDFINLFLYLLRLLGRRR
jgi:FtsH-binding integral membrane protein